MFKRGGFVKRNVAKVIAVAMAAGIAGTTTLSVPVFSYALEADKENLIWDVTEHSVRLKAENGYKYGIRYVDANGNYAWAWAESEQYVTSQETGNLLYVEFSGLKAGTEYVFGRALVLEPTDVLKVSVSTDKEVVLETEKETVKESETETEKETVEESETETEKETVEESETETEKETVEESETETEKETVEESETETEKETVEESETETETEKETVKENETETEKETVKESETETEKETVKESETETEKETVEDTESETEIAMDQVELVEELLNQDQVTFMAIHKDLVENNTAALTTVNAFTNADVKTIQVVDFDESKITGVAEGVTYTAGTHLTATAVGAGMDITNPELNEERWVPRSWDWGQESFTDWNKPGYSTTFTLVNVGTYRITVNFEREVYTEFGWRSSGVIQSKSVRFEVTDAPITEYTITASSESNGEISPSGNIKVEKGQNYTFTFKPDAGCKVSKLYVDGYERSVYNNQYTFTTVDANHTIHVTFEKTYKLDTPKTSDLTQVVPAMTLMFGSGSVMAGMIFGKRKDEE